MKKKNLLFTGFVALFFVGVILYSNKAEAQIIIEIPNFEVEDFCVCKHHDCTKGYWISFRKSCTITGNICQDNGICDE